MMQKLKCSSITLWRDGRVGAFGNAFIGYVGKGKNGIIKKYGEFIAA
jgi:hypothetical protein